MYNLNAMLYIIIDDYNNIINGHCLCELICHERHEQLSCPRYGGWTGSTNEHHVQRHFV
jgi:hypothetical protein